jgi:glycosyltransferase involved in cell wall biosynthesis
MKPFFSIVIPTLNEENFLPNLLKNLADQKYKNFEVIVVDGHSEDDTQKICQSENRFALRTFITKKRNVSHQRNYGASKARAEYIFFADADSQIKSDFLEKANLLIEKNKYLIIIPKIATTQDDPLSKMVINLTNYAVELSQITTKPFSSGGTLIIKSCLFQHINGFNENLFVSEDHDLISRLRKIGVRGFYANNLFYYFSLRRLNKDGLIALSAKYAISSIYTIFKGGVDKKIFSYEMGGARYSPENIDHKKVIRFKNLYEKFISMIEKM